MKSIQFLLLLTTSSIAVSQNPDQTWPQFRGINGSGVASESAKPPIILDESTLSWNLNLPKGVSSPVIWKEKLFITGFDENNKELHLICINNKNGKILWDKFVTPDTIEKTHQIGSPAQSTVVTNGEKVIARFGSYGILCYDMEGKLLWKYKLPCNQLTNGSATSLVISGDKLIYLNDFDNPYLMAINLINGRVIWKKQLNNFPIPNAGGQSVPCVFNEMIYIHRVGQVSCFSVKNGSQIWSYDLQTAGISSPIVANDKVITACWYGTSEEDQRGKLPAYNELIKSYDKNQNGTISKSELPDNMIIHTRPEISDLPNTTGTVKSFFGAFDPSEDGEITQQEWNAGVEWVVTFYKPAGLIAVNTQGAGMLTDDKVVWRIINNISEVPTPIFYRNRIYMIKDGGILTCVNPDSGNVIYSTRIGNPGPYVASPVAANGYIYLTGHNGRIKVLKEGDKFELAAENDLKARIGATPAIIGNTIFFRTENGLIAYSNK
jgi:outer membrane protein assembly factor BamB